MTTEIELLPLPEGNVAHLIAAQAAEIEALRAEVERLTEALKKVAASLEWYAHGRCRGFDDGAPLPTCEAVELAERTLAKVREECTKACEHRALLRPLHQSKGEQIMNIEQERTEFEAWYRLHHGSLNVYGRDASGEYADKQVQGHFNIWKARAALAAQDEALLRQALEALGRYCKRPKGADFTMEVEEFRLYATEVIGLPAPANRAGLIEPTRSFAIAALRERLGKGMEQKA